MNKERDNLFLKTIIVIFLVVLVEFLAFSFAYRKSISGFSIADITQLYSSMHTTSKIFLIIQWVIILVIVVIALIKNQKVMQRRNKIGSINIKKAMANSKTELDALYNILKERKELSIKEICSVFKIKEDLAMEWARILEAGELITIDYPTFGSPIAKIKELEEERVKEKPKLKEYKEKEYKKESKKHQRDEKRVLKIVKKRKNRLIKKKAILKKKKTRKVKAKLKKR
ncbi:hypothetical protein D6829_02260 [Candidatus Pacearchaeota archaeon]|nr:MAG: hypothetical protein D6829_02260 [Candidatus Pacearchaeota archaeon]